jgi:hypothetical protein
VIKWFASNFSHWYFLGLGTSDLGEVPLELILSPKRNWRACCVMEVGWLTRDLRLWQLYGLGFIMIPRSCGRLPTKFKKNGLSQSRSAAAERILWCTISLET